MGKTRRKGLKKTSFRNKAVFSRDPQSGFNVSDFPVFSRQTLTMIRMTEVPHQLY